MNNLDKNSLFMVNESAGLSTIKQELSELLSMTESMLQVVLEELNSAINCSTRLWYIQTWHQHLKLTYQLYHFVYCESAEVKLSDVFFVNSTLDKNRLRDDTTAYIHQLQSLCYLAVEVVFIDNINSHLQNTLIIINNTMQRAVYLIDLIVLNEFKPKNYETIRLEKSRVN